MSYPPADPQYGGAPQHDAANPQYGGAPQHDAADPQYGAQPQYGTPQYGGAQPQYGTQPQYGMQPQYGGRPAEHPQAQTVFVLGIVGIAFGILAIVAWVMGARAKKDIEQGAPYYWGGNLKTGYIMGKVVTIVWICLTVIYIILMIIMLAIFSNSAGH